MSDLLEYCPHPHIEPLTRSSRYSCWSIRMQDLLHGYGFLGYVDGTILRPENPSDSLSGPDTGPTPEQQEWDRKDRFALSAIRQRVADSVLGHVQCSRTSKEAWDTLKAHFGPSRASRFTLCRRLFSTRAKESADISEHLCLLSELRFDLASLGLDIGAELYKFVILASLPTSWDAWVHTVHATDLTVLDVEVRVLDEARRIQSLAAGRDVIAEEVAARYGHHGRHPTSLSNSKGAGNRSPCDFCSIPGHAEDDCRKKAAARAAAQRDTTNRGQSKRSQNKLPS